jgi:tripartite-type tricarboxylate transporter receptor subunit TctC
MNTAPLRLVVGFSPGSASDDIAQLIAARLHGNDSSGVRRFAAQFDLYA